MLDFEVCIFDIDGTLVDTSRSYTAVIQETVKIYLSLILSGRAKAEDILTVAEVSAFKQFGGFNNDWDTVAGVLYYFSDLIITHKIQHVSELLANKNIPEFIALLAKSKKIGLDAVQTGVKAGQNLVRAEGELTETNLVQRIFQELYYGAKIFRQLYAQEAVFYQGEGYYKREALLIDITRLKQLALKRKLAVATGRIRVEAEMVLNDFGILELFSLVITDSDVLPSERKPTPTMLYKVAKEIVGNSYVYVGDLPDDVKAANLAKAKLKMTSVAVGDHIATADYCFKSVNDFIDELLANN